MECWTNAVPAASGLPKFIYDGEYETLDDGDGNWRIKLLTTGILVLTGLKGATKGVDIFCVGGGGSGGWSAGSGGGGGYATTYRNIALNEGVQYSVIIGAGGTVPSRDAGTSPPGNDGGATIFYPSSLSWWLRAGGGKGGIGYESQGQSQGKSNGGSGGGGGTAGTGSAASGGSDGNNGGSYSGRYGKGQRTLAGQFGETGTTREFGEADGTLYGGGGGGGSIDTNAHGAGGEGGGGAGASGGHFSEPGQPNTGGGGGGGGSTTRDSGIYAYPSPGGSGIIIIRNAR